MKRYRHITIKELLLFVLALTLPLTIQACYSTAVKGTPVKELAAATEEEHARILKHREKQRQDLAAMSNVDANSVFLEIDGIPEYRIGSGDKLEINSRVADKVTTSTVTVDSRGRISYLFLDDIVVDGLTPSQLDLLLTRKLAAYIRKPRIDVLVKEHKSKSALILGELSSLRTTHTYSAASGKTYLKGKTTLMDLIVQSGGYTINADIRDVKLIRGGKTYIINLYDIIERGDQDVNVIIENGDVVDIPELPEFGERVYVLGEVDSQGVYSLKNAKDLLGAIALAGSFTQLAKEENTLIVRAYEPGKKPLVMMANLKEILKKADMRQNIKLEDGDLVYVPRMAIADVNDWIENMSPILEILLYPSEVSSRYFLRDYLHFDRPHHTP